MCIQGTRVWALQGRDWSWKQQAGFPLSCRAIITENLSEPTELGCTRTCTHPPTLRLELKKCWELEACGPRDRNCQMSCTRQWSAVGVDVAYTSVPTEKWGSRSLVWYVFRINGTKGGFFSPTAHHHDDVNNRTLLLLQNKQQTLRQTWEKKKRNMAPNRKTDYALQSKTIHSPLTSTISQQVHVTSRASWYIPVTAIINESFSSFLTLWEIYQQTQH